MKKSKFNEEQAAYALHGADSSTASRCSKPKARQTRALWDRGRADGAAPGGVSPNDRFP